VDGAAQTITGGRLNAAAALGNAPPDTTGPRIIGTEPADAVVGTLDRVRLRFSESIDPLSVSVDDVLSITGPDGAISVVAVTPVAGNSRQFDVTFAAQTALGEYTLVIGPNISDLQGNLVDNDRDGTGGEEIEDRFTATVEITDIVRYRPPIEELPQPIDNLDSLFGLYTESVLTINQDITVSDVDIQLNIWFPYAGDLEIVLVSPRGTEVTLSNHRGGEGGDFLDTTFDDEASVAIGSGFAPFFGEYRPDESLSAFDGQNARGAWKLRVYAEFNIDHFLDGSGLLNDWALDLGGSGGSPGDPPPPPPPPPGNSPPIAGDDTLEGDVNSRLAVPAAQLLANDTDADGDNLTIAFVGSPVGGSVSLTAGQLVIFEPDENFEGQASFQYIVTDGFALATGNVTVNIHPMGQWSNPSNRYDVNNDGVVSAGDVLEVINVINAFGAAPLPSLFSAATTNKYLDVNADDYLAPNDALAVIDYINANPNQQELSSLAAGGESPSDDTAANDAAILALFATELQNTRGRRK
jgi:subtilisin-like proprotein convertase family protein